MRSTALTRWHRQAHEWGVASSHRVAAVLAPTNVRMQSLQVKSRAGALLYDVIGLEPHTLPDGLAAVLTACLDPDADRRPNAKQLLRRLAAVRAALPSS